MKIYRTSFLLTGMLFAVLTLGTSFVKETMEEKHFSIKNKDLKQENVQQVDHWSNKQKTKIAKNIAFGRYEPKIVFDGLTLTELSDKLERNLGSDLKGKGYLFASYSVELGLDPYLAVAITLQETGCKWNCSSMVKNCYNVGGIKGGPKTCMGSSYKAYDNLDEGIKGFMDVLYYNYYSKGLTTPETINPIYAESTSWSTNVRRYMDQIKER